ncbi:hypothetical protein [Chryseobacterium jejuense]|uniref:hypothetical protein n=1 Tax=Chryseobacterium jejuense TaxID=445960 RepID=UPI001AE9ED50|nr:hypothetical protein [Chryseobacterium jejuense]MBP2617859.1 hypothetical protein [Chryseobacterium jejuense]
MRENYIQYADGYQKDDIDEKDILQAISDIQIMDEEHGAFWVSVITDDENVIEVNKDLSLVVIFGVEQTNYQAKDWNEVTELYKLLLAKKFEVILDRVV